MTLVDGSYTDVMSTIKEPINDHAFLAGYFNGVIRGQVEVIESIRKNNLMSDKELLDNVLERLKLALDTAKTMVG